MTVTRSDLERCIERVKGSVTDPRAGLYGPGTMSWHIGREGVVFLAGGAASLLQLAHPFVAYGVDEHSATREDTFGRFLRTFENVYAMIFGPLDRAIAASRRVHTVHERVTGVIGEAAGPWSAGSRYEANDEGALFWVQATLIMNAIRSYELVVAPLSLAEKDAYLRESRRFALLFGLDESHVPPDFTAFERYYEDMISSGTIVVTRPAREMARFLLTPPHPALGPVWKWFTVMTAALLPEPVRKGFSLPHGPIEAKAVRASIAALRRTYPHLPEHVRHVPAYTEAERRLSLPPGDPRASRPSSGGMLHPMLKLLLRLRRVSLHR